MGRWLAIGAVFVMIGVGVAARFGWVDPDDKDDTSERDPGLDTEPRDAGTPSPEEDDDRRTRRELQARIRELEAELGGVAAGTPSSTDPSPGSPTDSVPDHVRPPFRTDVTSDQRPARFLTFDQLTSLERADMKTGELLLQLEGGGRGRVRLAGYAAGKELTAELASIAEGFLLNRYDMDLLTKEYIAEELDRGRYEPFLEDALAYEHARQTIGSDGSDYHIKYVDGEYRVIDMRPLRTDVRSQDLSDEFQRLLENAKRLEPAIVGPVITRSWQ